MCLYTAWGINYTCVCLSACFRCVISRRGDVCDVTSGATYSLLGVFFFLSIFFYSSSNLSRYLSDLRDFCFRTRVMPRSFKRRRRISNILRTFCTGCKKPLKTAFFTFFFAGWPHVFDRCAKTVCARRNPKTNVSSTMNYLSSDLRRLLWC